MTISHKVQRGKWEREHAKPFALKQMNAKKVSGSIPPFFEFLRAKQHPVSLGLEMGCGKGRNVIWCAQQVGVEKITGFDFSETAIGVAKKRAEEAGVTDKTDFVVMDATRKWIFDDASFDFGIDCTASTDIESPTLRSFAISEMWRVLKPGGFLLVYVMSTDDEYHRLMIERSPAEEKNAFYHPDTGKFEKVFEDGELAEMYARFDRIETRRIEKKSEFFGKKYNSKMFWIVFRKPQRH